LKRNLNPLVKRDFDVARVAIEHKDRYLTYTKYGEFPAEVTGRLLFTAESSAELPKVGDWVAMSLFAKEVRAIIHKILPRKSKFSRKVAGKKIDEQIVVTNIDVIFIVQSLDSNFNLGRLERYRVMVFEGGSKPVVILNKADLCENIERKIAEVKKITPGVSVITTSAKTNYGMENLSEFSKRRINICLYRLIRCWQINFD